jgi:hypothetical protein
MADQQTYTPEYFQQLENYYTSYNANPTPVDTQMLQDWYGQATFSPGASISLPSAPATPTDGVNSLLSSLAASNSGGGGSSEAMASINAMTDPAQQLIALQNPITQALLSLAPMGLGGAISGFAGANAANQFNQIAGLYGGEVPGQISPALAALQGLFGYTPDAITAAQTLANQFNMGEDTTGVFAGYMQAATDPVLGSIVNSLASQAGPNGLTPQEYGVIGQAIGQQIQETMTANPGLSYESAGALTASNLGIDTNAPVGSTYGPDNVDVGGGWSPAATETASYSDSSSTSTDSGYSGGEGWSSSDYGGGWGGY